MEKKFAIEDHLSQFKDKYSYDENNDFIAKGTYGIVFKVKREKDNALFAMKQM
jgi:hypothetical protein